ncbi:MAG: hypothetical protein NVSMB6_25000 [Burkholderiaceae bacterium]
MALTRECDILMASPLYLNDMDLTRLHRRVFFCLILLVQQLREPQRVRVLHCAWE